MLAARLSRGIVALTIAIGLAVAGAVAPSARAADPGPVNLAIIAPIVAPPGATGFITTELIEQYTSDEGLLTRQLDAVAGRPVTLAIDPRIVASIRLLGTTAPASATRWLERLENLPNESFLLAYADSDVTLATQAGSSVVLAPQSLDFVVDPARFGPALEESATPTPTPTATAEPNPIPSLPTTEDLLAWESDFPGLIWPRAATVATSDLAAFDVSGFDTVLLSSGNVTRDARLGPAVEVAGSSAIVVDDSVSSSLQAVAATFTPEALQNGLPSLQAAVAASGAVQDGQANVVAALDRAISLSGSNILPMIAALEADPAITLVPLSEAVAGSTQGAADLVDSVQDADRVSVVARLLAAEAAEAGFATVVADPATVTAPRRLALLGLLSVGWNDVPASWDEATEGFLLDSRELLGAVQILTTSNFLFLADNSTLPIPVRNDLNQPVTVFVTVRPETGQLAVTDTLVELTVEPNSQAKAQIPAQAITNGTVQVLLTLTSASGVAIGTPAITEINVQAGWETPIVLVLAGVVVVVFGVGLVRNILRRRRASPGDDD